MKRLRLQLTLRTPTLLTAVPPTSNLTETLLFVPGNAIRGMLAHHYLTRVGTAEDLAFQRLFITGETHVGFGYIEGTQPIPRSARSCKYEGGFIKDGEHGVLDWLLAPENDETRRCPRCGQALDYMDGFWDAAKHIEVTVSTRLITRTGIDPVRGTARTGVLFSQRVLEEGQQFLTDLEFPDDLHPEIDMMFRHPFSSYLGTGASRGQGWVEVQQVPAPVEIMPETIERFKAYAHREGGPVLAVTLLSDGLFRDHYLRDITTPPVTAFDALGIDPTEWETHPYRAYMDTRMIFGFDGPPLGLPRQPRVAVSSGSAFLFRAKPTIGTPIVPTDLGQGWIGEGHREGYGKVVLWHPFHLKPESTML